VKVAAVILAGGRGTRMGGEKPLRLLDGVSLLDRAIDQAKAFSETVAVAVRSKAQIGDAGTQILCDDPAIEGPLAGLVAALRFARDRGADAALTLAADMPFLPADLTDRLVAALPGSRAAIASSSGHLHPVCGLWVTEALDFVPQYLVTGRRSLKGLAETVGYVAVEWAADPVDPFFNINTSQDLAAAERLLLRD